MALEHEKDLLIANLSDRDKAIASVVDFHLKMAVERLSVRLPKDNSKPVIGFQEIGAFSIEKTLRDEADYVEAIAAVNQIAEALGLTRNKDLTTILQAIAELKTRNEVLRKRNETLINMAEYAAMLFDVSLQKMLEQYSSILFDVVDIHRKVAIALDVQSIPMLVNKDGILGAIADLKNQHKAEARINPLGDLHKRLAIALNLGNVFDDDDVLEAIANLKHSLQLSQKEVEVLQEKTAIPDSWKSEPITYFRSILDLLADYLGIQQGRYELFGKKIKDLLAEKKAVQENTDFSELRSERDYYRDILDKLCDQLNAPDIEALEHIAIHQEMNLDLTSQYNDDLREKLATSQAINLKYMNRIVELENEVRSLKEPQPTTVARSDRHEYKIKFLENGEIVRAKLGEPFPDEDQEVDSDRLTNAELIQIVRSLIKP